MEQKRPTKSSPLFYELCAWSQIKNETRKFNASATKAALDLISPVVSEHKQPKVHAALMALLTQGNKRYAELKQTFCQCSPSEKQLVLQSLKKLESGKRHLWSSSTPKAVHTALAWIYQHQSQASNTTEPDKLKFRTKSIKHYDTAAKQGCPVAQNYLGIYYLPTQTQLAKKWFKQAAKQGHADAQNYIGRMHHQGEAGFKKNHNKSEKWYKRAAIQGHKQALDHLKELYSEDHENSCNSDIQAELERMYWDAPIRIPVDSLTENCQALKPKLTVATNPDPLLEVKSLLGKSGLKRSQNTMAYKLLSHLLSLRTTSASTRIKSLYNQFSLEEQQATIKALEHLNTLVATKQIQGKVNQAAIHTAIGVCGTLHYKKADTPQKSFNHYQQAAFLGCPIAQRMLGHCYHKGLGIAKNTTNMIFWYRQAAMQDDPIAQHELGLIYHRGNGVHEDFNEAARWYKLASIPGRAITFVDPEHAYEKLSQLGYGVPQDVKDIVHWYRKTQLVEKLISQTDLSELHQPAAYALLRALLQFQNGQSAALTKAYNYCSPTERKYVIRTLKQLQSTLGSNWHPCRGAILTALGLCYKYGLTVEQDFDKCALFFKQAALDDYDIAQCLLADCYLKGEGVSENSEEAYRWYKCAAQQGVPEAYLQLGHADEPFHGNKHWFRLASSKGVADAAYFYKHCIDETDTKNVAYLTEAAARNSAKACHRLAKYYWTGHKVDRNYEQALRYEIKGHNLQPSRAAREDILKRLRKAMSEQDSSSTTSEQDSSSATIERLRNTQAIVKAVITHRLISTELSKKSYNPRQKLCHSLTRDLCPDKPHGSFGTTFAKLDILSQGLVQVLLLSHFKAQQCPSLYEIILDENFSLTPIISCWHYINDNLATPKHKTKKQQNKLRSLLGAFSDVLLITILSINDLPEHTKLLEQWEQERNSYYSLFQGFPRPDYIQDAIDNLCYRILIIRNIKSQYKPEKFNLLSLFQQEHDRPITQTQELLRIEPIIKMAINNKLLCSDLGPPPNSPHESLGYVLKSQLYPSCFIHEPNMFDMLPKPLKGIVQLLLLSVCNARLCRERYESILGETLNLTLIINCLKNIYNDLSKPNSILDITEKRQLAGILADFYDTMMILLLTIIIWRNPDNLIKEGYLTWKTDKYVSSLLHLVKNIEKIHTSAPPNALTTHPSLKAWTNIFSISNKKFSNNLFTNEDLKNFVVIQELFNYATQRGLLHDIDKVGILPLQGTCKADCEQKANITEEKSACKATQLALEKAPPERKEGKSESKLDKTRTTSYAPSNFIRTLLLENKIGGLSFGGLCDHLKGLIQVLLLAAPSNTMQSERSYQLILGEQLNLQPIIACCNFMIKHFSSISTGGLDNSLEQYCSPIIKAFSHIYTVATHHIKNNSNGSTVQKERLKLLIEQLKASNLFTEHKSTDNTEGGYLDISLANLSDTGLEPDPSSLDLEVKHHHRKVATTDNLKAILGTYSDASKDQKGSTKVAPRLPEAKCSSF